MAKKSQLFQYAVLWHPTDKEVADGKSSVIIVKPDVMLSSDQNSAFLQAALQIPAEYKTNLDQVEIITRPF